MASATAANVQDVVIQEAVRNKVWNGEQPPNGRWGGKYKFQEREMTRTRTECDVEEYNEHGKKYGFKNCSKIAQPWGSDYFIYVEKYETSTYTCKCNLYMTFESDGTLMIGENSDGVSFLPRNGFNGEYKGTWEKDTGKFQAKGNMGASVMAIGGKIFQLGESWVVEGGWGLNPPTQTSAQGDKGPKNGTYEATYTEDPTTDPGVPPPLGGEFAPQTPACCAIA
jgi:hypothetical protein